MIIETFEQYSEAWWSGRRGIPTVSQFEKIVSSSGKKSTQSKMLACRYASEIESGKKEETYQSADMTRGIELEPEARKCYEFINDVTVEQVGMVFRDEKKLCACSPDGIDFENKRGFEVKCPKMAVHKSYAYDNKLPTKYAPQVWGSLWICDELETWDFMSYHPDLKLFIITVTREDDGYKKYVEALEKYLPEFINLVNKISGV